MLQHIEVQASFVGYAINIAKVATKTRFILVPLPCLQAVLKRENAFNWNSHWLQAVAQNCGFTDDMLKHNLPDKYINTE